MGNASSAAQSVPIINIAPFVNEADFDDIHFFFAAPSTHTV